MIPVQTRMSILALMLALLVTAPTVDAGVFDGGIPTQPAPTPQRTAPSEPACVRFATTARGPALVNLCRRCRRAAVAQAFGARQVATTRFVLAPRSALPLTGPKTGKIRIVADQPC